VRWRQTEVAANISASAETLFFCFFRRPRFGIDIVLAYEERDFFLIDICDLLLVVKRNDDMTERVAYPVTEPNLSSETPIDSQLMGFAESEPEYFMPIQELVLGSILSHNLKAGELLELKAGELLASVQIGQGSLLIKSTEAANNFAVLGTKNKLSFPAKVYSMVSEAAGRYPDAIRWVQNGAGFQVCRQSENLETLLRKYFNRKFYANDGSGLCFTKMALILLHRRKLFLASASVEHVRMDEASRRSVSNRNHRNQSQRAITSKISQR
jgi:hypothetical protein